MLKEIQKTEDIIATRLEEINTRFYVYLKIIALSFIVPLWISVFANGVMILWKILNWVKLEVKFWAVEEYAGLTVMLLLIPIAYLLWFYYLTIKRTLLQLYHDLLLDWNIEIGDFCASYLIELETKENKSQFEVAVIFSYINKKLSHLPKILQWVIRKLMDQIPFVAFVNTFDYEDLKTENKENLSSDITQKLNEFEQEFIMSVVPNWCMLIIPINIILLITYFKL